MLPNLCNVISQGNNNLLLIRCLKFGFCFKDWQRVKLVQNSVVQSGDDIMNDTINL